MQEPLDVLMYVSVRASVHKLLSRLLVRKETLQLNTRITCWHNLKREPITFCGVLCEKGVEAINDKNNNKQTTTTKQQPRCV